MSYAFGSFVSCPDIQGRIEDGYFRADPTMFPGHINALRAVTAPFNEAGVFQRQVDTRDGHYRQVEVVFQPRMVDSDTSSSADLSCTAGPTYGETSKVYNIDPSVGASRKFSFTLDELAPRCERDEDYIARQVAMHMQALKRTMSAEYIDFLAANFGNLGYNRGVQLTTKTKNTTTGVYLDDMLQDVTFEYQLAEGWDRPIILGGELSHKYFTAVQSSCCATLNIDLAAMQASDAQSYFFFDPLADSVFGAGEFAFVAPGATQMIRYNKFRGANGVRVIDDQALKQGVIVDPETGIEFDYFAQYDCGAWKFWMGLAYKYIAMPDDLFLAQDKLSGVNYIFNGRVSN